MAKHVRYAKFRAFLAVVGLSLIVLCVGILTTSTTTMAAHTCEARARITGTVIDQTTGAPVAGVPVCVGGVTVTTNNCGNYEIYVPTGYFSVQLGTDIWKWGMPMQGQKIVYVTEWTTTVVQHLYFSSDPAKPKPQPPAQAAICSCVQPKSVSYCDRQDPCLSCKP